MLERERDFFEVHRDRWLAECPGRFVVVHEDELVGVFATQSEALSEGAQRFGLSPFLVRRIEVPQDPIYIPALDLGLLRADSQHSLRGRDG